MEKKKYQVFVSSTFRDLEDERREVIQTLLEGDYIPSGMELFYASNDEQFSYIKKVIDNCDYYVLIIGGRYGSINSSTGFSFTEQEYDYAIEKNIPVLAFIHRNPASFPPDVVDPQNSAKLASFRKKVQANRMCKEWSTLAQLVSGVNHGLNRIIESHPRSGWSRGEKNSESVDKLVPESLKIFRSLELKNSQLSEELKEKKSSITRLDQQCSKFKQEIDLLEGRNKKLLDENNSLKKLIAKSPPKLSPGLLNLLKNINPNQYNNPEDDSILIRGIARKNNETFGYQKFFKWELIISCIVPSLVIIKGLDDIDRLLVRKINSIKDPMDPFLISIDKVTLKKIQQKLSLTHALNFD